MSGHVPDLYAHYDVPVIFFGCVKESGHDFWDRIYNGDPARERFQVVSRYSLSYDGMKRWTGMQFDGGELKAANVPDRHGCGTIVRRGGWTYLAVWDRSVDGRGASNAGVVVQRELSDQDMLNLAMQVFPRQMVRIGTITLFKPRPDTRTAPQTEKVPIALPVRAPRPRLHIMNRATVPGTPWCGAVVGENGNASPYAFHGVDTMLRNQVVDGDTEYAPCRACVAAIKGALDALA